MKVALDDGEDEAEEVDFGWPPLQVYGLAQPGGPPPVPPQLSTSKTSLFGPFVRLNPLARPPPTCRRPALDMDPPICSFPPVYRKSAPTQGASHHTTVGAARCSCRLDVDTKDEDLREARWDFLAPFPGSLNPSHPARKVECDRWTEANACRDMDDFGPSERFGWTKRTPLWEPVGGLRDAWPAASER